MFKNLFLKLKKLDDELINEYVLENNKSNVSIPKDKNTLFVRISGAAEFFYIISKKFVNSDTKKLKCLVVGLHGGRDYWGGISENWDVWGMDLMEYPNMNQTKIGNAEELWPFEDKEFDIIILGEILEHLSKDYQALEEAKRVLKDDGKLVVTVPFYDSNDNYHIRMYDKKTIVHTLNISGFKPIEILERPGLPFKDSLNYVNSLIAIFFKRFFGINIYSKIVTFYGELEYMNSKRRMFRKIFKFMNLNNYGGTILAEKSIDKFDYTNLNKDIFGK